MQLPHRPLIRCTMFGGPIPARHSSEEDPVVSLRALAALLARGHLTDHEFTAIAGRVVAHTASEETWHRSSS